ncbi:MAG: RNA methyltransferase [Sphingobacteriales bacterium]|nr:RNA methyltransferase [Sphingobacteriales bacterium]
MNSTLPEKLLASLEGIKGFDKEAFVAVHEKAEVITSIRLNPVKQSMVNGQSSIKDGIHYSLFTIHSKVPWSSNGYYLPERPSFTLDQLFHAGTYYVQEASSMFLEEAVRQTVDVSKPIKVLDLCAAPGGKSTLLQSIISADSLLVSNEVIQSRASVLRENIIKWGAANVVVTNNDPKDFQQLQGFFDVIVVDAPCSGSGLFRRDEEAIAEWSENNVQLCSQRQQRILADVLPALKEEGVLIYSTCSYSKDEDEKIIDWLINHCQLSTINCQLKEEWNIVESNGGYRFWPDKIKGEGFFIACFKKNEGVEFSYPRVRAFNKATKQEAEVLSCFLDKPQQFEFLPLTDHLFAVPVELVQDIMLLKSLLRIRYAGIEMGVINKNDLIPEHTLALSVHINKTLPAVQLNKEQALQYLRKQDNLQLELNGMKGWCLMQYEGINLGWAKLLPNRINNYYPKEWRILK